MSNICAGIGRGQMEVLDSHVELKNQERMVSGLLNQFPVLQF
jgi:hypothetical protein